MATRLLFMYAGCFHPPVPEGVVYYSDVEPAEDDTDMDTGNTTDVMSVFNHTDVLSFGCLYGFRAKDEPPQGQPFHTLTCHKGEWQGITPVCNGEKLYYCNHAYAYLTAKWYGIFK